ncbi:MAG: hypothetical protein U0599_06970 [Vicinamibacteria bacterium]
MRTIDARSPVSSWRRDLSLALRMAAMVFGYATAGARLRRAYRRCEERGETLFVDELGPGGHREEALGRR